MIDALDEVAAQRQGDAVDLVLQKLSQLEYPPCVLSCRVAEWRSAIASGAIAEQYDVAPNLLDWDNRVEEAACRLRWASVASPQTAGD